MLVLVHKTALELQDHQAHLVCLVAKVPEVIGVQMDLRAHQDSEVNPAYLANKAHLVLKGHLDFLFLESLAVKDKKVMQVIQGYQEGWGLLGLLDHLDLWDHQDQGASLAKMGQ